MGAIIAGGLVLLPVFYAFSIGPVSWACMQPWYNPGPEFQELLRDFYGPLRKVAVATDTKGLLIRYTSWWMSP